MNGAATSNLLVLDTDEEKKLGKDVSLIETRAESVVIQNDAQYAYAGELTKQVKQMQKKIDDYWEPMRKSTYAAYKSVTEHKKDMIDPCKKAEQILKRKMSDYSMEQERIRRQQEEEMRRQAQAEVEKKLAEAQEAEALGDSEAAEAAIAEAEVMDDVAAAGTVQIQTPKLKGVSSTRAWRITNIDVSKVPDEIAGIVIRPVDEKAVMQLIKATKGAVKIPGIEYEETRSISVRS